MKKEDTEYSNRVLPVKKNTTKRKAANDSNKPKRPASPFFEFMEEFRKRFQGENPHNKSIAAIGQAGGIKWKAMSDAEKAPYVAKADKMKVEYTNNMEAYTKEQVEGGNDVFNKFKSEVKTEEDNDDDDYRLDDDFDVFGDAELNVPSQNEPYDDTQQTFEEVEEPCQDRGKGKFPNRARAKPWDEREVIALAKAWICASEDDVVRNQQKSNSFWMRILTSFSDQVGGTTRSHHQLNSKWNAINAKISRFNGIYIQMKNMWESGLSDVDIMNKAQKEYRTTYDKKGFNLVEVWQMLRDHPKWLCVLLMGKEFENQPNPSKKSKTSESGNDRSNDLLDFRFNLNEDSPTCTKMKQRWKKLVGGSSSKEESLVEVVSQYKLSKDFEREEKMKYITKRESITIEVLELQKEMLKKEVEKRDWDTYIQPHDHLHPALIEHVMQKKRAIAEKYGWPIYF